MNKYFKKLFAIIAILSFAYVVAFGEAAFAASGEYTSPGVGFIYPKQGLKSEPYRTFRLVRYVESSYGALGSLSQDNIVVFHTGAVTYDGITVTTTTTSGDSAVAGVLVTAAHTRELGTVNNTAYQDLDNRNWCWIQTYGPAEVYIDSATPVTVIDAGAAFGTGSQSGYASVFTPDASESINTPKRQGIAGFFLSDASAKTDVPVFVRCE